MGDSAIQTFYKGKNVFITGGTGFVGIALIEKLLRSTEVNKIYMLIRPKKGKDPSARIEDVKKNPVFLELIKQKKDQIFDKIVAVGGDVGDENLGLSVSDRQLLINDVDVVFHSAATLDFEANLKTTVQINLLGTRRVVALCKEMKKLKALLHVSSCYVNSHLPRPEEKLYKVPQDADKVIKLVEESPDQQLEEKTAEILGEYINTYTFTKALAEQEVDASIALFPSCIVRPSMINAAWKEPVPGWTMSKNGPQGFLMGATKGVVRRLPVDPEIVADYIPVDVVINGMIVGAWFAATKRPSETPIFHLSSSSINPFKWSILNDDMDSLLHRYPLKSAVWYPVLKLCPTLLMFKISALIFHWIPALILDTVAKLSGGRTIMHTNINNSLKRLKPFIFTEWVFDNKRTMDLFKTMDETDQRIFNFDIQKLDYLEYFDRAAYGIRQFLHNEKPESIPAAKKKDFVLKLLNYGIQFVFIFFVWTLFTLLTGSTYNGTAFSVLPAIIIAYSLL